MGLLQNIANRLMPVRISKANALDEFIIRQIANSAVFPDYKWGTYLKGYTENGDVFTVINKITEPASIVPIYQYDKNGEINEQGRMISLLNKPNDFMSQDEFIETALSFYLIFGDCFTSYDTIDNGLNAGVPLRLDLLPPQWTEIVIGTVFEPIQGYRFTLSGNILEYEKERVMHWREFNPDYGSNGQGHLKGMSRLKPILKAVIGNESSYKALVALLQHQGAVGILTILGEDGGGKPLSKTFLSAIKNQYRNEYTGADKAGSIVITSNDHKWTSFGMNVSELKIIESLGIFRGAICDAYNVPSMLLSGSQDRTYNNFGEADRSLWTKAICPSLNSYLDKLSKWLAPKFKEEGQVLMADYTGIEALQKNIAEMIAWMVLSKSFTKNEIREAAGFDMLKDPAMDKVYESAGSMPLDELGLMPGWELTEGVLKALKISDYRYAKIIN